MKKSAVFILVSLLIICLIGISVLSLGGVYVYNLRPNKSLKFNQTTLKDFKNLQKLSLKSNFNGEIKLLTGIAELDNINASETNTSLNKEVTFEGDKIYEKAFLPESPLVSESKGTERTKQEIIGSDIFFLLFSDQEQWNEILNKNLYSLEQEKDSLWRIKINQEQANKLFINNFKKTIVESFNSESEEKIDISAVTEEFAGNSSLILEINQNTKTLSKFEFSIDSDLTFKFNEQISKSFTEYAKLLKQGDKLDIKFQMKKDYRQTTEVSEMKFVDDSKKFEGLEQLDKAVLSI